MSEMSKDNINFKPNPNHDERPIVPYIRRDDIAWWAGCRFEPSRWTDRNSYIRETSCFFHWSAVWKARRMAKTARKLRAKNLIGTTIIAVSDIELNRYKEK